MQPTPGKAVFVRDLVILNFDINLNFYTRHIQVHLKKIEYREKGQYFCHSFQKVKPIYYTDVYQPSVMDDGIRCRVFPGSK